VFGKTCEKYILDIFDIDEPFYSYSINKKIEKYTIPFGSVTFGH